MPRQKKNQVPLTIRFDAEIAKRLKAYCDETGQTKTMAIERILRKSIEEYFAKPEENRKAY